MEYSQVLPATLALLGILTAARLHRVQAESRGKSAADKNYDYFDVYDDYYAQTEGDTGYEYNDAYDDDYDDDPVLGMEPSFDVQVVNVTVVEGQTAVLPCSIEYLGQYKVAWLDAKSIPLTYVDRRVVDDHRFSIVRPYLKEWNLQIRDILWKDRGQYRCTINTNPVKSKVIMLHVKVPPKILDDVSSDDVTVQEGDTVVLICNVTGVPRPEVTWYRRPASSREAAKERIGMTGEMVIIQNVSRHCDDIYKCVAHNGVQPSVSRQMRVTVEFPPEITMPNRRMGQRRGKDTILECIITAYPHAVNYWKKDGRKIVSSSKHKVEAYDEGEHSLTLSLRISDLDFSDYGQYTCIAANALGKDEQTMDLYEYAEPLQQETASPTERIIFKPWTTPATKPPTRPVYKNPDTNKNEVRKPSKVETNEVVPKNQGPESRTGFNGGVGSHRLSLAVYIVLSLVMWRLQQV